MQPRWPHKCIHCVSLCHYFDGICDGFPICQGISYPLVVVVHGDTGANTDDGKFRKKVARGVDACDSRPAERAQPDIPRDDGVVCIDDIYLWTGIAGDFERDRWRARSMSVFELLLFIFYPPLERRLIRYGSWFLSDAVDRETDQVVLLQGPWGRRSPQWE